jgi:Asp-tRNA(Asn)/Glu-tRNA(Gln) amidotransferase A subunit family amidase
METNEILLNENLSKVDSSMLPSPFNNAIWSQYGKKKLKFGYYFDDGVVIASPPVKRAILKTINALKSQGHQVIPITLPNTIEAVRIFASLTSAEGYPSQLESANM